MIKLRVKSKYFFEGDIIRHLLWGRREINIKFLNLGQPLTYILILVILLKSKNFTILLVIHLNELEICKSVVTKLTCCPEKSSYSHATTGKYQTYKCILIDLGQVNM